MMRTNILFIFCLIFSGCALTTETRSPTVNVQKSLTNIERVQKGMTYEDVKNMMDNQVNIGYQLSASAGSVPEIISVKNPYRRENLNHNGKTYEIFYYFTAIKSADGIITDDELTPLIFLNNKLIGQGQDFLFNLKN